MFKQDTLISLLSSNLPYIVSFGIAIIIVTVIIISQPARLWRKAEETVIRNAGRKLFRTLQHCRNDGEFSPILEKVGTKIELTFRNYATSSYSNKLSLLMVDIYKRGRPCNTLILGEPGGGKSTFLQQCALDFMDAELQEIDFEQMRLPVFVSLHEWVKKKQPFDVFLLRYLMDTKRPIQILPEFARDRALLRYWLNNGKFILLLDGLDEMTKEDSKRCVEILNAFSKDATAPIIISCRLERYETLRKEQFPLEVTETWVVCKLRPEEVRKYFIQVGATRLSRDLYQEEKNQALKEIAVTPLVAHVLAQTFSDSNPDRQFLTQGAAFFDVYTRNAIENKKSYYSDKYISNMRPWLTRLARYMGERPFFYFRPDYLPGKKSKMLYVASTWLVIVLLGGVASLFVAYGRLQFWQLFALIAIIAGFYGYLHKSVLTGLYMTVLYILAIVFPFVAIASSPAKTPQQKIKDALTNLALIFLLPLFLSLVSFVGTRLISLPLGTGSLVAGSTVLLIEGLLWYTFYRIGNLQLLQPFGNDSTVTQTFFEFVNMLIIQHVDEPLSLETLAPKVSLSTGNALFGKVAEGIVIGAMISFVGFLFWHTNLFLLALLIGISIWLDWGLGAGMRGYLLRFCFWMCKILPWKASFLNDAVICSLLVQQGDDSFNFLYEMPMQDYFRKSSDDEIFPATLGVFNDQPVQPDVQEDRNRSLEICCCYDSEDEKILKILTKRLKPFQKAGLFTIWSVADIAPGDLLEEVYSQHLERADIILLLISPDFIASETCYSEAMVRAIQRHEADRAVVLPIQLRPSIWKEASGLPFAHLPAFPKQDAVPVSLLPDRDQDKAWNDIASEIYRVVLDQLPFYR